MTVPSCIPADAREDPVGKKNEDLGIAKKAGHRDQQVPGKRLHFLRVLLQQAAVGGKVSYMPDREASVNTALDGPLFVGCEIVLQMPAEHRPVACQ